MKALLRWSLLLVSASAAVVCVVDDVTRARAAVVVSTGTLWFILSRRKALSIDRDHVGIPRR